jgi:hypothetical protein
MSDEKELPNLTPGYVPVKTAAKILGVSERSVYGYIEENKLQGHKATHLTVVSLEDLEHFKRGTTGRPRTRVPEWRISDNDNVQSMTQIFVQLREGQKKALEDKLEEIRKKNKHIFPGTVARYITHSQADKTDIQILLIWRGTVMPDEGTRTTELAALRKELDEFLEWESAHVEMHEILMHT